MSLNRPHTEEELQRIRDFWTPEQRHAHSETMTGKTLGKPKSEDTKRAMQESWTNERRESFRASILKSWTPERREQQRLRMKNNVHKAGKCYRGGSKALSSKPSASEERQHDYRLRYAYKKSRRWYEKKLAEQGGGCAICGAPRTGKMLAVDHDHSCCRGTKSCGKCVRGILCDRCNTVIGRMEELELDWHGKAMTYLEQYRSLLASGGSA